MSELVRVAAVLYTELRKVRTNELKKCGSLQEFFSAKYICASARAVHTIICNAQDGQYKHIFIISNACRMLENEIVKVVWACIQASVVKELNMFFA